jgi:hypothetical protein
LISGTDLEIASAYLKFSLSKAFCSQTAYRQEEVTSLKKQFLKADRGNLLARIG